MRGSVVHVSTAEVESIVGIVCKSGVVGDDHNRLSFVMCEVSQFLQQFGGRAIVECTGRLVEQQYCCGREEHPSKPDALTFSSGE